jgi:hypothetical protein
MLNTPSMEHIFIKKHWKETFPGFVGALLDVPERFIGNI